MTQPTVKVYVVAIDGEVIAVRSRLVAAGQFMWHARIDVEPTLDQRGRRIWTEVNPNKLTTTILEVTLDGTGADVAD